jgi:CRP-like cAMP-binding protein
MSGVNDRPAEPDDPGSATTDSHLGHSPPHPEDPLPHDRQGPKVFKDNRLLTILPKGEREKLEPFLEQVYLEFKQIVYEPNEPIDYVYFPINGIVSMITIMDDGSKAEVGTVGNEGMVGIPVFLNATSTPGQAFSQIAGDAFRMKSDDFRQAVSHSSVFRDVLHRYLQALFNQIAQTTACNRVHSTEQRLARWILMTEDRVGADTFSLTQEFMGQMLGVRRATVNEAAGRLQRQGVISYRRGVLTVRDRKRLEGISCECYAIVRKEFERLLNAGVG